MITYRHTNQLTDKEVRIAKLLIESPDTIVQIAEELEMSTQVLKNIATRIYGKTGAESRLHLIHWAIANNAAPWVPRKAHA